MADNLSAERGHYGTSASHSTVQAELSTRMEYEQQSVLQRLGPDAVDSRLVKLCAPALQTQLRADFTKLMNIANAAAKYAPEYLDQEHANEGGGGPDPLAHEKKSRRENEMYAPLKRIFDFIRNFQVDQCAPEQSIYARAFLRQSQVLVPDQYHTLGFPRFIPDFSLVPHDVWPPGANTQLWRDRAAFVEVKPSSQQHPYPATSGSPAPPLLTQVANYARLHLSARPFSVFSVSLLIFGCDFCVCIFDRGGGQLSPRFNMWRDIDVFIRVVRSMTRMLTDEELGRDPSVTPAPATTPPVPDGCFVVNPIGDDPRYWCTLDVPMWSSLSLFGRGTTVYRVREIDRNYCLRGPTMILKSTWRSSGRSSEARIYQAIQGTHPGLSKFIVGGDVMWGPGRPLPVTVHSLRGTSVGSGENTVVLHRIITESVGVPIWEYRNDEQLVSGFISALEAHKFLYDQGILHRDISAGNILLSAEPAPQGAAGFLTDLEFARIEDDNLEVRTTETVHPPTGYGRVPAKLNKTMTRTRISFITLRGAAITGTLQFMSRRILRALAKGDTNIATSVEDDVESFMWALSYAVLRNLIAREVGTPEEQKEVKTSFSNAFGATSAATVLRMRSALPTLDPFIAGLVLAHVSAPLLTFFADYQQVLAQQHLKIYNPTRQFSLDTDTAFNHDVFIPALQRVLKELREERRRAEKASSHA
ncbi:hypothetical protein OH77DRAFT_1419248 [Trametes cingulata]|nr:hypothetical protein OH77DRAFT_1419248 [Trametes cingulata]